MGKRGRRPHPDILTPREWEVLDLLRQRLTNEQIAERLGITLDGAKYHVSEILSKLGVGTREDAAAWQAKRELWWQRVVALPTAAKIAGALTLIATVAGLAFLAWGVAETGGPAQQGQIADWSDLPKPKGEARLTRDAALLEAIRHFGSDLRGVDIEVVLTTYAGATRAMGENSESPYDPEAATWLVRLTGIFDNCVFGPCGPAIMPPVTRPPPSCRDIFLFLPDAGPSFRTLDGSPGLISGGGGAPTSRPCRTASPQLSRDEALVAAARDPTARVHYGQTPPLADASAEMMTYSQAQETLADGGWRLVSGVHAISDEGAVWLVVLNGLFPPPPEQLEPSPPGPSDFRLICTEALTIIDPTTGSSLYNDFRTAAACYRPPPSYAGPVTTPSRTPTVDKDNAIVAALEQAGMIPGQTATKASADLLAFAESASICYCYPPVERPDSVWVVTLQGLFSEPLNPKAPATPPSSQPTCSDLIAVISGDTGTLFASIFQRANSCS